MRQVKPVYMEWQAANEKHLKAEEDVRHPKSESESASVMRA